MTDRPTDQRTDIRGHSKLHFQYEEQLVHLELCIFSFNNLMYALNEDDNK